MNIFNLPEILLLKHAAKTNFAFNGNKIGLKTAASPPPPPTPQCPGARAIGHAWLHPRPPDDDGGVREGGKSFAARWASLAPGSYHTTRLFQIIKNLPHVSDLEVLYDNIRLLYPYKIDMPD